MDKPIFSLSGGNGRLDVYENKIVFNRSNVVANLLSKGSLEANTIYISKIESVKFRKATIFEFPGYLAFTLADGTVNGVTFDLWSNDKALQIKNYVEQKLENFNNSNRDVKLGQSHPNTDAISQIERAKNLLDKKAITEEEYIKLKDKILKG